MRDQTKQQLNGIVEADADRLLAVAVEGEPGERQTSEVVVDTPPEEIPALIGMLLVAGEEGLGIPAPMLAYEATKQAEQFSDIGDVVTVGVDGDD